MKWAEVRKIYPNRFVKLQILEYHIENNIRYIDEMAVIKAFDDEKEATRELVRSKDELLVYHTGKENVAVPIKQLFSFRGSIQ